MTTGSSFEAIVRRVIFPNQDVTHTPELRRSTVLFSQGDHAQTVYFIESGLIKLTRTNKAGGRIIIAIRGAGDLVGEEALGEEATTFSSEAEVISTASLHQLPQLLLQKLVTENTDLVVPLMQYLIKTRNESVEKVELLCLHDVEYRVLFYLARLCTVVSKGIDGIGYQIPITQLELADLIGATRETTSTVLNQLERRGLVHLSRRMLTVPSTSSIEGALDNIHEVSPTQAVGAERASQPI